ncbi:MAG: hypothetical protein MPK62_05535, partial [Alphaproteobacteria bacterium]|nr:hypothetical protein [Alphaproteobacteria bacterium]
MLISHPWRSVDLAKSRRSTGTRVAPSWRSDYCAGWGTVGIKAAEDVIRKEFAVPGTGAVLRDPAAANRRQGRGRYADGSMTRPMNRSAPVSSSWIMNMN